MKKSKIASLTQEERQERINKLSEELANLVEAGDDYLLLYNAVKNGDGSYTVGRYINAPKPDDEAGIDSLFEVLVAECMNDFEEQNEPVLYQLFDVVSRTVTQLITHEVDDEGNTRKPH
jgi:hypothetical protein